MPNIINNSIASAYARINLEKTMRKSQEVLKQNPLFNFILKTTEGTLPCEWKLYTDVLCKTEIRSMTNSLGMNLLSIELSASILNNLLDAVHQSSIPNSSITKLEFEHRYCTISIYQAFTDVFCELTVAYKFPNSDKIEHLLVFFGNVGNILQIREAPNALGTRMREKILSAAQFKLIHEGIRDLFAHMQASLREQKRALNPVATEYKPHTPSKTTVQGEQILFKYEQAPVAKPIVEEEMDLGKCKMLAMYIINNPALNPIDIFFKAYPKANFFNAFTSHLDVDKETEAMDKIAGAHPYFAFTRALILDKIIRLQCDKATLDWIVDEFAKITINEEAAATEKLHIGSLLS